MNGLLRMASRKSGSLNKDEQQRDGAKRLKRRALGFCGWSSRKTLSEMAKILYDVGMVSSVEKGMEIVPNFNGLNMDYSHCFGLSINRVSDNLENEVYRVCVFSKDF